MHTGGGHTHDALAYHYHSTVTTDRSTSSLDGVGGGGPFSYTTYDIAPTTCWKGDVSQIYEFWTTKQANYDRSKQPNPNDWTDLEALRPCCGSDRYYVVDGVALDGASEPAVDDDLDDCGGLCANQPVSWDVGAKLQNSLARSNRSRFG